MVRTFALCLAALALVCFAAAPALAEEKDATHEGTFVKAEDNKIYLKDASGKEHVLDLELKPTVTSDGTSCKISDLRAGVKVKVWVGDNKKVNKVAATDTHEGTFVKAEDNKIYLKDAGGKEQVFDLELKPTITLNGAAAKFSDLKAGDKVRITVGVNKKVNKVEGLPR
jgi:hypothetical protein